MRFSRAVTLCLLFLMFGVCVFSNLFATVYVLLVFFGLEIHEQFVGPINLGLQVKASLLFHVVGRKIPFELLSTKLEFGKKVRKTEKRKGRNAI